MKSLTITLIMIALSAGAHPAHATDAPPDLLWPLDASPAVSSNFCEYREGHLHAGLDVRTFGAEGIRCLAAADGYVSRVRAAPSGYGKVVYVQLDSGETLVYAHLSEFAPTLEDTVYKAQLRAGRYRVDLRPAPGRFPVQRGDVIGYSGSTGTSAPHLHFEIRSREEHPLDPFLHGFSLADTMKPVIRSVEFIPLDSAATGPLRFEAIRTDAGRYAVCDTVRLSGSTGLSIQTHDLLNEDSGRLAPHIIEVSVDGVMVARVAFERFSFAHADQVDLVYDIDRVRRERAYFFRMFRQPGELLWDREFDRDGVLTGRGAGFQQVRVVVLDRAANSAILEFVVEEAQSEKPLACETPVATDAGLHFLGGFARRGTMSLTARDLGVREVVHAGDTVSVFGVIAGKARTLEFDHMGFAVEFKRRTLYADVVGYARPWLGPEREARAYGLARRSGAVEFGPYGLALRADVTLRFQAMDVDSTTAIYRLNERKGEWVHYASTIDGNRLTTTARRPGVYCVFRDMVGPRVGTPRVRHRESYATGARLPEVGIPIDDDGSGVDDDRTEIYLSGTPIIARWDPSAKKMFVLVRDKNIMGTQEVAVVAYDRAGNRSMHNTTVDLSPKE